MIYIRHIYVYIMYRTYLCTHTHTHTCTHAHTHTHTHTHSCMYIHEHVYTHNGQGTNFQLSKCTNPPQKRSDIQSPDFQWVNPSMCAFAYASCRERGWGGREVGREGTEEGGFRKNRDRSVIDTNTSPSPAPVLLPLSFPLPPPRPLPLPHPSGCEITTQ